MSFKIEIDLCADNNQSDYITLKWQVLDTTPALFWTKLAHQTFKLDPPFYARMTGFHHPNNNMKTLSEQLNRIIEVINSEGNYIIKQRADGHFSQNFANEMHHHFELLYGEADSPSDIYKKSSKVVQSAITKINHIIHDMEALERSIKSHESSFSALIGEFLEGPRIKMPQDFYSHFTLDLDFADIVYHYGQIGKTWWEVYLDEDQEIFPEAIRPLDVLSGEFDIHFGSFQLDKDQKQSFNNFLKGQGQEPLDPELRLGYLPIAKLIRESDMTDQEYKKSIANHPKVFSIRILKDQRIISQLYLKNSQTVRDGFFQIHPTQIIGPQDKVQLQKVPVQLVPLQSKDGPLTLPPIPFTNHYQNRGHAVTLLGTSNNNPILVSPSHCPYGLRLKREYILRKGDTLPLLFNHNDQYYFEELIKQ